MPVTLKLVYSQYRELQSFAQFGSDLDADTKARLAQGERIVEVLKQESEFPDRCGKTGCDHLRSYQRYADKCRTGRYQRI